MGYFLAALLSGFFLFNGAATPDRAAKIAQKSLRKQYPGAAINVQIEGKRGASVLKGNFRRVRVEMAKLTLAALPFAPSTGSPRLGRAEKIEIRLRDLTLGQLPASRVDLDFDQVAYDFDALKKAGQFRIVRLGAGRMQLQLSAQALLPAFAAKLQNTTDVSVETEGQNLTVRGNRTILGASQPILVTGQLAGRGSELRLENASLSVGGTRLPSNASGALLKDLNPLYDFDKGLKWPFRTHITSASGNGNQIDLSATLSLQTQLAANSSR